MTYLRWFIGVASWTPSVSCCSIFLVLYHARGGLYRVFPNTKCRYFSSSSVGMIIGYHILCLYYLLALHFWFTEKRSKFCFEIFFTNVFWNDPILPKMFTDAVIFRFPSTRFFFDVGSLKLKKKVYPAPHAVSLETHDQLLFLLIFKDN